MARVVAGGLQARGRTVFFDEHYRSALWGQSLYQALGDIYRNRARFVVPFVSRHYNQTPYTRRELQAAQDRAIQERREFILPLRLDDAECPGLRAGDSFVDLRSTSVDQVCDMLAEKLDALGAG